MTKQILLFVGGLILGFALFFLFNLTTPTSHQTSKLTPSTGCGVITTFKYCGSNEYLCEVSCNLCSCSEPQCQPLSNCTP